VNAGRLVADGNESDAVFVKLGEHWVDFRARQTENELDSLVRQTSDQELSTVNFCHRSLSSISLSTADTYRPSRLSTPDIVREAQRSGIVATISDKTVWRWLHDDAIRTWQHRSRPFPRDPEFVRKE